MLPFHRHRDSFISIRKLLLVVTFLSRLGIHMKVLQIVYFVLLLSAFLCCESEGKRDMDSYSLHTSFLPLRSNAFTGIQIKTQPVASWTQLKNTNFRRSRILQQTSEVNCASLGCSRHGTAVVSSNGDRECTCESGFEGLNCQLNNATCPAGQLDYNGECCASGIFDSEGSCCGAGAPETNQSLWRLDISGSCCNSTMDNCGVCGGGGFVDSSGNCCNGGLDADGRCCESNDIDECGVCDGFGKSCATGVEITVESTQQNAQVCLEDFLPSFLSPSSQNAFALSRLSGGGQRFQMAMNGSTVTTGTINSRFSALLEGSEGNPCSILNTTAATIVPVCGNGVCEIGEAPRPSNNQFTCSEDCKLRITSCRSRNSTGVVGITDAPCSGNGVCYYAQNGRCECFEGYAGEACDQCSEGFFAFKQLCVPRQWVPVNLALPCSSVFSSSANSAPDSSSDDSSDSALVLVLLAVSGLLMFVFIGILAFVSRKLAMGTEEGERGEGPIVAATTITRGGEGASHEGVSPSSASLFSAYLRGWASFQRDPPWVGSCHQPSENHQPEES